MVRVLIVDDSAIMRRILSDMLSTDPEIEVVGTASDPLIAREMIKTLDPDVLTLDIEMPRLDGLVFLEKLMQLRPMPVVMISALTQDGADATLQALEIGAVDFIAKPKIDSGQGWLELRDEVISKVKAANQASVRSRRPGALLRKRMEAVVRRPHNIGRVIGIGASTGGVGAVTDVLSLMLTSGPPILVAQHMPPAFTKQFAKRINDYCAVSVHEANDQEELQSGHAYIAPGDRHLSIIQLGGRYFCKLETGERINGHIPAVDVLFASLAAATGAAGIGVLLTGMGKDGAKGLGQMRQAGGITICQDEASCVVYGMPRAAVEIGAVMHELPLSRIGPLLLQLSGSGQLAEDSALASERRVSHANLVGQK